MPATRFSVLETKAHTDLRPGESGLRLKDDPYYGKVDIGAAPDPAVQQAKERERKERARISQLPAEERADATKKLNADLAKAREQSRKRAKGDKSGEKDDPSVREEFPTDATRGELMTALASLEARIEEGAHVLDGDDQSHVEVLTGRRLQQRVADDAEPREPEEVTEPDEGLDDAASRPVEAYTMEPPERDRDKTRAAKPGESVAPVPGDREATRERNKADKDKEKADKEK
jgi:hypothetical protein